MSSIIPIARVAVRSTLWRHSMPMCWQWDGSLWKRLRYSSVKLPINDARKQNGPFSKVFFSAQLLLAPTQEWSFDCSKCQMNAYVHSNAQNGWVCFTILWVHIFTSDRKHVLRHRLARLAAKQRLWHFENVYINISTWMRFVFRPQHIKVWTRGFAAAFVFLSMASRLWAWNFSQSRMSVSENFLN